MLSKQLSVFLENKGGRLTEVTELFGQEGINISAMSIADNSDFGILRCIVSDPERAMRVLRDKGFAVKTTEVIGFRCPNTSGALAAIMRCLSDKGVFIEYLYSFNSGDVANIVIRPTDLNACDNILAEQSVNFISPEDFYNL